MYFAERFMLRRPRNNQIFVPFVFVLKGQREVEVGVFEEP